MEVHQSETFVKAKKRVDAIKQFYQHLTFYSIVNIGLIIIKLNFFDIPLFQHIENKDLEHWLEWNIILTPVLWGIGLFFHGLYVFVFKSKPLKDLKFERLRKWEEKQIQKYMEEDD